MHRTMTWTAIVWLGVGAAIAAPARAAFVWVEGEQPTAQKDIAANAGLNRINPYAMSGDKWISSFSEKDMPRSGEVEYSVEWPQAGRPHLWLRAALGTGMSWRLDNGAWTAVDSHKGVDSCAAQEDGGLWYPPTLCWYDLGALDLTAGKHTVAFLLGGEKKPGEGAFAGLDCFVLTADAFKPDGKYKPGETAPTPFQDIPTGKGWDFAPAKDALAPDAVLDLRYLNEKTAGESGFVRLSKDGNDFVRGDGHPIRFWAVGESADLDLAAMKQHAQFLAKRGVNMVRLHCGIQPKEEGSKITDVDEKEIAKIQKTVVAMKAAGIYSTISPYWGTAATIRKSWETLAAPGQNAEPLLFVDPTLQKGYRAWLKELYTRPNPFDAKKLSLAADPSVAIIQLQNENSLLFWSFANLKGELLTLFRTRFADFLKQKYGSIDKARAAWNDYNPPASEIWIPMEWDKGLPGLAHPWDFTRDGLAKKRSWPGWLPFTSDQLEFTARTMYDFNAGIVTYLHHDLGCKQLVNAGNWRGVDPVTEQDAEYWSYTAGDVIGKNRYTGGYHQGQNVGWQVLTGSYYTDMSVIKEPVELPVNVKQVEGHPMIIPETTWVYPNLYQSEAPLMVAAQTSLTGFDINYWFCIDSADWTQNTSYKWSFSTPLFLGMLPANALIFRQGMVEEAKPAVVEYRTLDDVWQRKTPLISEESGWDPNRDTGNITLASSVKTTVDPLAHMVGPVRVVFGGDPKKSRVIDLAPYIDREKKIVRSETGEIETDYGKGVYTLNTPMAQAAAGFLSEAGPQRLADVEIACRNRYATIAVVAMDGKPIKKSTKVLVQVGTICRPTGWTARPDRLFLNQKPFDCLKLVNQGNSPWQVEKTDGTVTVANAKLVQAVCLDVNGMRAGVADVKQAGGKATLTLPADSLYVVLTSR